MVDPGRVAGTNAGTVVAVAVAVVLVAVQAGLIAFGAGIGPFATDEPGPRTATTPEPGDPGDSGGTGGSGDRGSDGGSGDAGGNGGAAASTPEPPPYDLDVLGTEPCGNTCQDVTVRLTNNRNGTAADVSVRTRIYAGNTTGENARVWEGGSDVGTLGPGESTTQTARVSLSYFEAIDVKRKGGWVTIVTTVASETETRTFQERRKVA